MGNILSALVPNKILPPLEHPVQYADHALRLVLIARLRRGQLLGVRVDEPGGLPEVGALAADLEEEVLVDVVFLRGGRVG
jgi:hypothetical protein